MAIIYNPNKKIFTLHTAHTTCLLYTSRCVYETGMSVTFISSETDEMLRTCSRLIVMRDRRKVGEISGEDLSLIHIFCARCCRN